MCMSGDSGNAPAAADFLVHMTSPVSVRRLASSGHLVPANLEVALSDDFLQPGREPLHAQVFTNQRPHHRAAAADRQLGDARGRGPGSLDDAS